MYDEVNNENENENRSNLYGTAPEPADSEIKDAENVTQEELHAEEMVQQEETPKDPPSFYHYTYDRTPGQNREDINENDGRQEDRDQQTEQPEDSRYAETDRGPDMDVPYGAPYQTGDGQQAGKPKRSLKNTIWPKLGVGAAVALVFGVVGSAAFQATNYVGRQVLPQETEARIESAGTVNSKASGSETEVNAVPVSASGTDIAQVVENCMPSIVAITTVSVQQVQNMFYGTTQQEEQGSGSGIIVAQNDSELLIATNNHVVEGANTLSVCFTVDVDEKDIQVVEGQIKGTDPGKDLAIVAVDLKNIPEEVKKQIKVIEMGDSENLKVGQQVVAIGNALGYGQSVTVGYVSAMNREVTVDNVTNELIQTDAAINFGNSGGALLNTNGQLVGINSVKAAATGVEGMGYAIPINTASPILSDLMNRTTRNKVDEDQRGYMGVSLADVSDEAKEIYNMPSGAFVYSIEEGSAAEKAGIKKGDIITQFDGISITSRDEMLSRMEYYKQNETVDVIVQAANNGEYQERTVSITLDKKPVSKNNNAAGGNSQSQQQTPEGSQQIPDGEQQMPDSGQQMPDGGQQGGQDSNTVPFQDLFPEMFGE